MPRTETFSPDWVSPPGDTISDILRERNLSINDFTRQMGQATDQTADLLTGRTAITIGLARRLRAVLGPSVEFWMSRDFRYRQPSPSLGPDEKRWLRELPLGDMVRFRWLNPSQDVTEQLRACLQFFGVPNVGAWHRNYGDLEQKFSFRASPAFESSRAAVAAWLRRGEIQAENVPCALWDAQAFADCLTAAKSLIREKDAQHFVPRLQHLCAKTGVAVLIVRAPKGCHASGATRFVARDKAMLLLSFRHLSEDHFWFSFFHEAAHLLLHSHSELFIEGEDIPTSDAEAQANEFASHLLIPREHEAELLRLPHTSFAIARFARRVGVSPGIVVGQLQHYGRIKQNHFNRLKRHYTWEPD